MKKKLLLSMAAATILSSNITVCASPQYMADGAVFDPEWYLEQYPDVAGWAQGTSADALYMHYTMFGASEGRKPFNEAALDTANILPYQGADTATPEQPAETTTHQVQPVTEQQLPLILMRDDKKLTNEKTIMAAEGQSYSLELHRSGAMEKISVSVSFRCIPQNEMNPESLDVLAPYKLPGYEWKEVQTVFDPEYIISERSLLIPGYSLYVDGYTNWHEEEGNKWSFFADNSGKFWHDHSFTVNLNGIDYPQCAFFTNYPNVGADPDYTRDFFILVPENYNRGMSLILWDTFRRDTAIRFDF